MAPTASALPVVPFSGVIPAGTYAWTSFEPHLTLAVPAGWQVGHRHRDYFDLFPATATSGGGPGVGFGRFRAVFGPNGAVSMTTAAATLDALGANPSIRSSNRRDAELLGLSGLSVEMRVDAEQTPVFDGEGGAFKMDPGWVAQSWFLDVEGGVLLVAVFGLDSDAAADLATSQAILAGVSLAP